MIGKANNADTRPSTLGIYSNTSTYGSVIPAVYGRTRVPLSAIWANNLRKHSTNKKNKKKDTPTYSEAVDFLLGSNPIVSPLRFWVNNGTTYGLNFVRRHFTFSNEEGSDPVISWEDDKFYCILGVAMKAGGQMTQIQDYGDPAGAHYISGDENFYSDANFRPLWNLATAGPNPTEPHGQRHWPYCYHWLPGDGPSITLPGKGIGSFWFFYPYLSIYVYYAQLHSRDRVPASQLRMTFEPQLGDGSEYGSKYASQRIIYPPFAGIGSPNLDLGATAMMPNIRTELLGSFPLWSTGDCDLADIVEDIFTAAHMQAAYGLTTPRTTMMRGLQCYDYPGLIQKQAYSTGYGPKIGTPWFNQPFFYQGSGAGTKGVLIAAASATTGWTATATLSDDAGHTWMPVVPDKRTMQRQLWYAMPNDGAAANALDQISINFDVTAATADVQMVELAGLDGVALEASAILQSDGSFGQQYLEQEITVNSSPDYPCVIISWAFIANTNVLHSGVLARCLSPVAPLKEQLISFTQDTQSTGGATVNKPRIRMDSCVVRNPGTYRFRLNYLNPKLAPGINEYDHIPEDTDWTWVLLAFKATQPAGYARALGDILDHETLEHTRLQCRANGLKGSLCMDSQKPASDWLSELYIAMNAAPIWSGFKLKTIPYSEVSLVDNGARYISPAADPGLIAHLGVDDFIGDADQPMVTVAIKSSADTQNVFQLQHPNRDSKYADITATLPDSGAVAHYGNRTNEQLVLRAVQDDAVAQMLLGIMTRRSNVLDKTYKFTLSARWKLLEPLDIVTITDLLAGIDHLPVRLTGINEDSAFNLECEAEPYVWGLCAPKPVSVTTHNSNAPDLNATPASVNAPVFIETTAALGPSTQAQLWIAVSDTDEIYGGCQVWVSTDGGVSYSLLGAITGNAVQGVLTAAWPLGADPDTSNDLAIDLTQSLGELASYTVTDEDAFTYPFYVKGASGYELGAYAIATLTDQNKYTLQATGVGNKLRRGILQSTIMAHSIGDSFVFLNPTGAGILKADLPHAWIGKPISFKFAAVNSYGGGAQDLADCTPFTFTPTGVFVSGYQNATEKGQPGGYAGLGEAGTVPADQLGSGTPAPNTFLNGNGEWTTVELPVGYFTLAFTAQTSVVVTHNLGGYPMVQVISNAGQVLIPKSITHNSPNALTVTFATATTGTVIATKGKS